jgi:hypothetical protein
MSANRRPLRFGLVLYSASMTPSVRHDWTRLNRQQLGRYAEYLVKMEFVLFGCDVFTSEVDDHGIDFVVRTQNGNHYDVQVKSFSLKGGTTPYVFLQKEKFKVHPSLLLALVQFVKGQAPTLWLLRSGLEAGMPHSLFESRDYVGKQSDPEWGLTLSKKKRARLEAECGFECVLTTLE